MSFLYERERSFLYFEFLYMFHDVTWWWPQFRIETRFHMNKTFYKWVGCDCEYRYCIFTTHTHTHTHTRYRHQSNSKAAASSYVRRMPQFYSPSAIWSIFQVPKIVDMDINSLLGIIGYNLYLKHIRWCVNQKYILIYSITHHACFVIVLYLVTCFTWWLLIIQEHGKYQETVLTTRLLKFMPAIPPDVLSIK